MIPALRANAPAAGFGGKEAQFLAAARATKTKELFFHRGVESNPKKQADPGDTRCSNE